MAKDYHKILGINKSTSRETFKKTCRDAVEKLHPDLSWGAFDKKQCCDIQGTREAIKEAKKQDAIAQKVPVTFAIASGVMRGVLLKIFFETKQGETHTCFEVLN